MRGFVALVCLLSASALMTATAQPDCFGHNCDTENSDVDMQQLYGSMLLAGTLQGQISAQNYLNMTDKPDSVETCLKTCSSEFSTDMQSCNAAFLTGKDGNSLYQLGSPESTLSACYAAAEQKRQACFGPIRFMNCMQ